MCMAALTDMACEAGACAPTPKSTVIRAATRRERDVLIDAMPVQQNEQWMGAALLLIRRLELRRHIFRCRDRLLIDQNDHIAGLDAAVAERAARRDIGDDHTLDARRHMSPAAQLWRERRQLEPEGRNRRRRRGTLAGRHLVRCELLQVRR